MLVNSFRNIVTNSSGSRLEKLTSNNAFNKNLSPLFSPYSCTACEHIQHTHYTYIRKMSHEYTQIKMDFFPFVSLFILFLLAESVCLCVCLVGSDSDGNFSFLAFLYKWMMFLCVCALVWSVVYEKVLRIEK